MNKNLVADFGTMVYISYNGIITSISAIYILDIDNPVIQLTMDIQKSDACESYIFINKDKLSIVVFQDQIIDILSEKGFTLDEINDILLEYLYPMLSKNIDEYIQNTNKYI